VWSDARKSDGWPIRFDEKITDCPSKDHRSGLAILPRSDKSRTAPPPLVGRLHSSSGSPICRVRTKSTYCPSGENAGPQSSPAFGGSVTAADQHFARAYYNLGILYLEGKGVHQDNAEALLWFQKGADAGDSSAQTNFGYMYDLGVGWEKNIVTAAQWYRKAAHAGNPLGENNLADLYLRGEGVAQDDVQAFHWFQKAADQGHTGARIKLGYMYEKGRGTAKDPQTAYFWISAASAAGDNRGRELQHALEQQPAAKQIAEARDRVNHLQQATLQVPASTFVQ